MPWVLGNDFMNTWRCLCYSRSQEGKHRQQSIQSLPKKKTKKKRLWEHEIIFIIRAIASSIDAFFPFCNPILLRRRTNLSLDKNSPSFGLKYSLALAVFKTCMLVLDCAWITVLKFLNMRPTRIIFLIANICESLVWSSTNDTNHLALVTFFFILDGHQTSLLSQMVTEELFLVFIKKK